MPGARKKIYNLLEEDPLLSLEELEILMLDEKMSREEFEKLISYFRTPRLGAR
jgi:hypothetical protein